MALQGQKNATPILNRASFEVLTKRFQGLKKEDIDAYRATIFISAVTMTPEAVKRAKEKGKEKEISRDSVEFLADTVEKCPEIYPVYEALSPEARNTLKPAFWHHTHLRHMMYTEGGNFMFRQLREGISQGKILGKMFDFWFNAWTLNIAGFRAQENPKGAYYLNENTFQALEILRDELLKVFENQKYLVLESYLNKRAVCLGLPENGMERLALAHVGAMMRLFTKEEGCVLLDGVARLPSEQRKLIHGYDASLKDDREMTPTYIPAYFANAKDKLAKENKGISEVVSIYLPAYLGAHSKWREGRYAEQLKVPLSFRVLAERSYLEKIEEAVRGNLPLAFDFEGGNVTVREQPGQKFRP